MAWNDWIVKHAKAIVAVWIIVIFLAAPLAARLNDVTNYSMDQFLPRDVESVKVQEALESDFPSFSNSTNQTYMIVTGIDVNSPKAEEAYEELKNEAKPYGSGFLSYYDAVDILRNKSDEAAVNVTKAAVNLTSSLYNSTVEMNETYGRLLQNISDLSGSIDDAKTALRETAETYVSVTSNLSTAYDEMIDLRSAVNETATAYLELQENLTALYYQMRELSEALNQTASSYPLLLENLSDLYSQMENLSTAVNETAAGYIGAEEKLRKLYGSMVDLELALKGAAAGYLQAADNLTALYFTMGNLSTALNSTDGAYVELHANLTETSAMLRALNATINETNAGIYTLNATYGRTYSGTVGVYKALTAAGAYSRGSLDPTTAQAVAGETGTTVEFVYAVFNATDPVYQTYGAAGITDGTLANVTSAIITSAISDPVNAKLAGAYAYAFYLAVKEFDSRYGSDYALQALPSEYLAGISSELATAALETTPRVIEASGESMEVPGFGTVDSGTLAALVNSSISLGPNPSPISVENATVDFALGYVEATQPDSPLLKLPNPREVLMTLLVDGPTVSLEEELLENALLARADNETRPLVPLIVNTTLTYDPDASGVLTHSASLLEDATVKLTGEILEMRGAELDESVLRSVYESGGNETKIADIAKELVYGEVFNALRSRGNPDAKYIARRIVDVATADPEGILSGEKLEDAVVSVTAYALGREGEVVDGKVLRAVYRSRGNGEILSGIARTLVEEELEENLREEGVENYTLVARLILNASLSDPEGISEDPAKLENATVTVIEGILAERGIKLEGPLLREVYESGGNRTKIAEIAREALYDAVKSELKKKSPENADELADLIVETAVSRPEISSDGKALEEATVDIVERLLAEKGVSIDERYLNELYEGSGKRTVYKVTREILTEKVAEQLRTRGAANPGGLARTIVDTAAGRAYGITHRESVLDEATIEVARKAFADEGVNIDERYLWEIYRSGGDRAELGRIARELVFDGLVEKLRERGVENPEKTATTMLDAVMSDPEGIASGEGLEDAAVRVVVELAGDVELPGNSTLEEVARELYEGASPEDVARELFIDGVREELSGKDLPAEVKEGVIEIAETIASEYPLGPEEARSIVRHRAVEIVEEELSKNPVTEDLNATLIVDIAMKHGDDPDAVSEDEVEPIAKALYSKLYEDAEDYINMLKSPDNKTMLILFTPKGGEGISDLEKASRAQYESSMKVKELALKEFGKDFKEVEAYITGTPVQTYEMIHYGKEDNDKTTKFSIAGALVVLLILMGVALLATLLPFTGVATATLTALGVLYLLARGDVLDVGSWAQMLTVTTALGLGIDYSTYYLHRFREYLAEGYDHERAASEALKRAKDAVLASASTDIIAFASFVLAWEFPIFKTMGIIAPMAVVIVLLASLTFIPAMTVLIGDKPVFWWPRHIEHHIGNVDLHERSRMAEWAVKHAKVVVILALLIAVPAAYNFANFHGTHDIKLFIPKDSETYHFLQLSDETVGAGVSSPTYVVIDLGHTVRENDLAEINAIAERIERVGGVEHVYTLTMPYGKLLNSTDVDELKGLGGDRYLSSDGHKVLIQVTGRYEATDERSKEMVRGIRAIVKDEEKAGRIADGKVGGNTALALDLSNLINDVFWHRIFPVALLLMFLSLIPTLRGLPAVIATMGTIAVGVLLSITISSWLFERVFGQQVMWFLPLMVFIVLMGVGIDYNSFYLVKARDEFERRKPEDALVVAAGTMDTLVVGLAAVLAVTYGSLMSGATWGIREIGFALALGVLLTATAAVYLIGPATMALFGEKAWWPLHRAGKKE